MRKHLTVIFSCKETAIKSLPAHREFLDLRVPPALEMAEGRAGGDLPPLTARRMDGSAAHTAVEADADSRARVRATHTPTASSLHTVTEVGLCHPALALGAARACPHAHHGTHTDGARCTGLRPALRPVFAEWSRSLWALRSRKAFCSRARLLFLLN